MSMENNPFGFGWSWTGNYLPSVLSVQLDDGLLRCPDKKTATTPDPRGRGGGGHGHWEAEQETGDAALSPQEQPDDRGGLAKDDERHGHAEDPDVDLFVGHTQLLRQPDQ